MNVPHTVFKQEDGELLSQIMVHQFHQKCKGIAINNIDEALPFCQIDSPISTEGVGMIIVDYQDPRIPTKAEIIQFPAICSDTGDSMLVLGALIQLGQKKLCRNPPANCSTIDEIPTSVVRTIVYRDQFTRLQWDKFVQGPVKTIMELDAFRELPEGSIIDVWDRQHVTKSFQKTKAQESEMFFVSFRCTRPSAEQILESSGREGYIMSQEQIQEDPPMKILRWFGCGEVIVLKQTLPAPT